MPETVIRQIRISEAQPSKGFEINVFCHERGKPLTHPQLKRAAVAFLEEALEAVKEGEAERGGFAGSWYRNRREDLMVNAKKEGSMGEDWKGAS